jgi:hypothetical protein
MNTIEEELLKETRQGRIIKEQDGDHNSRHSKTSTSLKILHHFSTKTVDQAQGVVFLQEEEEEDLRRFKFMIQRYLFIYCRYHGRGHNTEACPETKNNIA